MDACGAGELDLAASVSGRVEVVEAEVARQPRLVVAGEAGNAAHTLRHSVKPFAPPFVVLGNRVELRQVERDQLRPPRLTRGDRWIEVLGPWSRRGPVAELREDVLVQVVVAGHGEIAALGPGLVVVDEWVDLRIAREVIEW